MIKDSRNFRALFRTALTSWKSPQVERQVRQARQLESSRGPETSRPKERNTEPQSRPQAKTERLSTRSKKVKEGRK